MIRVTQIFTCAHPGIEGAKPHMPVKIKSQGHSLVMEARYCLCTGEAVPMRREIEHHDPDAGRQR